MPPFISHIPVGLPSLLYSCKSFCHVSTAKLIKPICIDSPDYSLMTGAEYSILTSGLFMNGMKYTWIIYIYLVTTYDALHRCVVTWGPISTHNDGTCRCRPLCSSRCWTYGGDQGKEKAAIQPATLW